jgi:hypothetical protein
LKTITVGDYTVELQLSREQLENFEKKTPEDELNDSYAHTLHKAIHEEFRSQFKKD